MSLGKVCSEENKVRTDYTVVVDAKVFKDFITLKDTDTDLPPELSFVESDCVTPKKGVYNPRGCGVLHASVDIVVTTLAQVKVKKLEELRKEAQDEIGKIDGVDDLSVVSVEKQKLDIEQKRVVVVNQLNDKMYDLDQAVTIQDAELISWA